MTKTFTQDDLIRFIYRETTEEETQEINRVLKTDPELNRKYRELLLSAKRLDKATVEPSSGTIERIINYVRGLEVRS